MYWRSALDAFAADRRGIESWFVVPNAEFVRLLGWGGGEPEIIVAYRLADEAGIDSLQRAYEAELLIWLRAHGF